MPRILSILDRVLNQGIVVLTVFFLGALCFSLQQLSTMPFIEEIECAEGGTTRFPFTKELCLQHLFMFRGSEADIASLQQQQGAMRFVVPTSADSTASVADRAALLSFVASRGLNIDIKEDNDWTPLHAAIRDNDLDGVTMLLRLQPSLDIKAGPQEQTPMQMAKASNNDAIVAKLEAARQHQHTQFVLGMHMSPEAWQMVSAPAPTPVEPDVTKSPSYGID